MARFAESASAGQVERLVSAMRDIDRGEREKNHGVESRGSWRWNYDGTLSVDMRLSPVDGAHLLAGLVRSEYERTRVEVDPDLPEPPEDLGGLVDAPEAKPRDLWRDVPANIAPAMTRITPTSQFVTSSTTRRRGRRIWMPVRRWTTISVTRCGAVQLIRTI